MSSNLLKNGEIFSRISAIARKKRSNQKIGVGESQIKILQLANYSALIFYFLEARAEILEKNRWIFGRFNDTNRTF